MTEIARKPPVSSRGLMTPPKPASITARNIPIPARMLRIAMIVTPVGRDLGVATAVTRRKQEMKKKVVRQAKNF
jgi:hypothetical protein